MDFPITPVHYTLFLIFSGLIWSLRFMDRTIRLAICQYTTLLEKEGFRLCNV